MVVVSNADRIVFPAIGRTKGDVVRYYERIAPRILAHVAGRPLSIRRFPKGLAGPGFFQKNVPAFYPESIERFALPRSKQRRRAAHLVRDALAKLGLRTVPVATGSKGYHVVAAVVPKAGVDELTVTIPKLAALLEAKHPDELTTAFRVARRGKRVFIDWLRNNPGATVVAPFSLRARPRATVATPLTWAEIAMTSPDAFTIDDLDQLLDRPDPLADLGAAPDDTDRFMTNVDAMFEASGLVLETFDRFRS